MANPFGNPATSRTIIDGASRASKNTTFNIAYEQRLHYASGASGIAAIGILPSEASTPFRVQPLVWRVTDSGNGIWRHEIDRANTQVHARRADLTIGRQAIGWGRGVMFTAVDLFAPFSPLEVDREWRSGVDAVRADVKLTERSSVDFVGAFGDRLSRSAFCGKSQRVRRHRRCGGRWGSTWRRSVRGGDIVCSPRRRGGSRRSSRVSRPGRSGP